MAADKSATTTGKAAVQMSPVAPDEMFGVCETITV